MWYVLSVLNSLALHSVHVRLLFNFMRRLHAMPYQSLLYSGSANCYIVPASRLPALSTCISLSTHLIRIVSVLMSCHLTWWCDTIWVFMYKSVMFGFCLISMNCKWYIHSVLCTMTLHFCWLILLKCSAHSLRTSYCTILHYTILKHSSMTLV
jgi:hypothetical protein